MSEAGHCYSADVQGHERWLGKSRSNSRVVVCRGVRKDSDILENIIVRQRIATAQTRSGMRQWLGRNRSNSRAAVCVGQDFPGRMGAIPVMQPIATATETSLAILSLSRLTLRSDTSCANQVMYQLRAK